MRKMMEKPFISYTKILMLSSTGKFLTLDPWSVWYFDPLHSAEDNAGAKKSKQLWQRKISYRYRLGNAWVEIIEVLLREKTVNMNEELYKKGT